jgi:hypothetical protein
VNVDFLDNLIKSSLKTKSLPDYMSQLIVGNRVSNEAQGYLQSILFKWSEKGDQNALGGLLSLLQATTSYRLRVMIIEKALQLEQTLTVKFPFDLSQYKEDPIQGIRSAYSEATARRLQTNTEIAAPIDRVEPTAVDHEKWGDTHDLGEALSAAIIDSINEREQNISRYVELMVLLHESYANEGTKPVILFKQLPDYAKDVLSQFITHPEKQLRMKAYKGINNLREIVGIEWAKEQLLNKVALDANTHDLDVLEYALLQLMDFDVESAKNRLDHYTRHSNPFMRMMAYRVMDIHQFHLGSDWVKEKLLASSDASISNPDHLSTAEDYLKNILIGKKVY